VPFRKNARPGLDALEAIWVDLGADRRHAARLGILTQSIVALFLETRADQVEINPVGIIEDEVFALDAKITVDDAADLPITREQPALDPNQRAAQALGVHLVRLDGDVGVITSGAGLGLATIDTIQSVGGRAANFLDLGGGATSERMCAAVNLVTSLQGIRGLFVNVHGGLNDCQLLAHGMIAGLAHQKKLAVLIRMSGFRAAEGLALLEAAGIAHAGGDPMECCVSRLLEMKTHAAGIG
jgi:succinyl-CoA synthetase beta subunit